MSQEFVTRDLLMEFRLQQFIHILAECPFKELTRLTALIADQQFPVASEVFCFSVKNSAITAGVS
jgi:hypothetical protein